MDPKRTPKETTICQSQDPKIDLVVRDPFNPFPRQQLQNIPILAGLSKPAIFRSWEKKQVEIRPELPLMSLLVLLSTALDAEAVRPF
jgi:hypothetical protein